MSNASGARKGKQGLIRLNGMTAEGAMDRATLGESEREAPGAGMTVSQTVRAVMEMKPAEFEKYKARTTLTKRELVAIKWVERLEEMSLRGGPQILAEALDRLEGKVVIEHRLRGVGDKSGMSDPELDRIWRRRQSRQAITESPTH